MPSKKPMVHLPSRPSRPRAHEHVTCHRESSGNSRHAARGWGMLNPLGEGCWVHVFSREACARRDAPIREESEMRSWVIGSVLVGSCCALAAVAACATLGESNAGEQNLAHAGVGPFRPLT